MLLRWFMGLCLRSEVVQQTYCSRHLLVTNNDDVALRPFLSAFRTSTSLCKNGTNRWLLLGFSLDSVITFRVANATSHFHIFRFLYNLMKMTELTTSSLDDILRSLICFRRFPRAEELSTCNKKLVLVLDTCYALY